MWEFCDDLEDKRNARVCSPLINRELFSSRVRGGPDPVVFFVSENRMQMVHLNPYLVDLVLVFY